MNLIGKYVVIALIAFVLVMTPVLRGNQITGNTDDAHDCCGCCCGCADRETDSAQPEPEDNNCCCQMTDSEAPVEVPFDAQVQIVNHDTAADISAQSGVELKQLKPISNHNSSDVRAVEHGPPLYKINSAYLI